MVINFLDYFATDNECKQYKFKEENKFLRQSNEFQEFVSTNHLEHQTVLDISEFIKKESEITIIRQSELADREIKGKLIFSGFINENNVILSYQDWLAFPETCKKQLEPIFIFYNSPFFHQIVIGSTGYGKTSCNLYSDVLALSGQKTKPNLCIVSSKPDILRLERHLDSDGYKSFVIDLSDAMHSAKVNIFAQIISICDEIRALSKSFTKKYSRKALLQGKYCLHGDLSSYKKSYYVLGYDAYQNKRSLNEAIARQEERLYEKIETTCSNIAANIISTDNVKDIFFPQAGRRVLAASVLAIAEMYIASDSTGFNKKQFNFMTLNELINTIRKQADARIIDGEKLAIFKHTPRAEKAIQAFLDDYGNTRKNVFSVLQSQAAPLFSTLAYNVTIGENEEYVDLNDKEPIALIIRMSEYQTQHQAIIPLIIDTICHTWEDCRDKSNTKNGISIERPCHFLLDEFGNINRLHALSERISTARARNIFLACTFNHTASWNLNILMRLPFSANARKFLSAQMIELAKKDLFSKQGVDRLTTLTVFQFQSLLFHPPI